MAGSVSNRAAVAAIILAAGLGSRMGDRGAVSKVLSMVGGQPMILAPVRAALDAGLSPIIVVVGHAANAVQAALVGLPVTVVHSLNFDEGMGASLRAGVAAVPEDAAGAAILLSDMPGVTADHLTRLRDAFDEADGAAIVAPISGGRRGNPVVWPRALFPELRQVTGDVGGREVLRRHAAALVTVALDDCADGGVGVLRDIDTPEDLARWDGNATDSD